MQYRSIRVEKENRLATVFLNRPHAFNAINEEMAAELRDVFTELNQDDEMWVVVLTGAGEAFCRGTDLAPTADMEDRSLEETLDGLRVADSIAGVGKPVIAAINGDAIGQGLELALACDLRIAAKGARLALPQVQEGLLPWDGGTQRLPRLIGHSWATYMLLTACPMEAQEAMKIGLVNEVVEASQVVARAQELASLIARYGPIAAGYAKEALLNGADLTLEQGLRLEADLNLLLQSTRDRAEGIRSFLERRTPEYRGE